MGRELRKPLSEKKKQRKQIEKMRGKKMMRIKSWEPEEILQERVVLPWAQMPFRG